MESGTHKEIADILARPPAVGEQAPDFALDTPEGPTLTLRDLKVDRTLIIFARHLG